MSDKKKALEHKKHEYTFHDVRSGEHKHVPYSHVRSVLKKDFGKNSKRVREMLHNLKPRTSEAIPSKGGYYGLSK